MQLDKLNQEELETVYSFAKIVCRRCTPNSYVQGRYEKCELFSVRCKAEEWVYQGAKSKDQLGNCPFS